MEAIPWSALSVIVTLLGALIGIAIGWGAMRSVVNSLKNEVMAFKAIATEVKEEVATLKADGKHAAKSIESLTERVNELEKDVSALKAKQSNRRGK